MAASEPLAQLAEQFRNGDRRALARLITHLDTTQNPQQILDAMDGCYVPQQAKRTLKVGLTGSAGTGKSTLAAALARHLRAKGRTVAILACDPTSPFSGGALLGDRVRFEEQDGDAGVFFRSLASHGAAGGVPGNIGPMLRLVEQFGFDTVLVETVGAGQDQMAVRDVVDVLALVVAPNSGDMIQWQKAGLLEAADVIAVNKADLPGADRAVMELQASLEVPGGLRGTAPSIVKVTAAKGEGVAELWAQIERVGHQEDKDTAGQASRGTPGRANAHQSQGDSAAPNALEAPDIDPQRGFLPCPDPLDHLPEAFAPWEQLGQQLPRLLVAQRVRQAINRLPPLRPDPQWDRRQLGRAMVLLSFLGHAYVWGEGGPATRLPPGLAVSWHEVAQRLGRPPVLSYASYALDNWRRLDPQGPIALGNIILQQNFLGGVDEAWFILVHVEIEAKAAPALQAIRQAQAAVTQNQPEALAEHLEAVAQALGRMHATLARMPERCDPYIYYHRVRPYIHGWKDNPALPEGLIYEGVEAYAGKPQKFRGETGAQSSIIPSLDAALGVNHRDDPLRPYLLEMFDYMPPRHRAFIQAIQKGPSIREYVKSQAGEQHGLREAYNACIDGLATFRSLHLEYASTYIHRQTQRDAANPTGVGTGGTPFMPYLQKHRDETLEHKIGG